MPSKSRFPARLTCCQCLWITRPAKHFILGSVVGGV
jgi:hypothetical protein